MGIEVPVGASPGAARPPGDRELTTGEVLLREGDVGDEAFEVLSGVLEIVRGPDEMRIAVVGPGTTLGEIAMLAGCRRTATARAIEPSVVRAVDRASYERWVDEDDARSEALAEVARARIDGHRLLALIRDVLGVDAAVAAEIAAASEWVRLGPGEELFAEGDPPDAAFLLVSGRLTVVQGGDHVREVARGELVGEIGLIERAPRSASIIALRDSTLARFDVDAFRALTDAHPALMLQVARTILGRLGRPNESRDRARSIAVAVTAPIDGRRCLAHLADELACHGTTRHLSADGVDAALGQPGLVESGRTYVLPALSELLQDAETGHDYLLLEMDAGSTRWTRVRARPRRPHRGRHVGAARRRRAPPRCGCARVRARRRADRALAGAGPPPWHVAAVRLGRRGGPPRGRPCDPRPRRVGSRPRPPRPARVRQRHRPRARRRRGEGVRPPRRVARPARARHRGRCHRRSVDRCADGGDDGAAAGSRRAGGGDRRAVPRVARLHRSHRVPAQGGAHRGNITRALADIDLRDTWHPFFCVSTNLTRSRVEVHDRSSAATAVRASVAIPGVLPPVPYGGDLLVDGGVLNNLPCDVMRATGMVDRLIAVDLSPAVGPQAKDDDGRSVSGWRAWRGRRSQLPGIVAVIMRSMVAGSVRDRDRMLADGTVDCYLDLDLRGVGLLDFERVAEVAARGYRAALPRLTAWRDGASIVADDDGAVGAP